MKKIKLSTKKKFTGLMLLFISILISSCKTVDSAIDWALDFEGVFENSSGYQIKLESVGPDNGVATYTKLGTVPLDQFWHADLGEKVISDAHQTSDNTWSGVVAQNNGVGFLYSGVIRIDGDVLTIMPDGYPSYSYTRVGTGDVDGNTGSGGGSGTTVTSQVLIDQCVSGQVGDRITFTIDVPANVKKMEIQTSEVVSVCDFNTADLFVRKGSKPTVTKTPTYSWVADCASINPNRDKESCTFNNPSSGKWYIMLFGYNIYFISHLNVTITY